jgi:hypothetical protein
MSADNGIYILKTAGPEWRVAEMMAIDNLYYPDDKPETVLKNAREMFARAEVFKDRALALVYAFDLAKDCDVLEYGVSELPEIEAPFNG